MATNNTIVINRVSLRQLPSTDNNVAYALEYKNSLGFRDIHPVLFKDIAGYDMVSMTPVIDDINEADKCLILCSIMSSKIGYEDSVDDIRFKLLDDMAEWDAQADGTRKTFSNWYYTNDRRVKAHVEYTPKYIDERHHENAAWLIINYYYEKQELRIA